MEIFQKKNINHHFFQKFVGNNFVRFYTNNSYKTSHIDFALHMNSWKFFSKYVHRTEFKKSVSLVGRGLHLI